MGKSTLRKLTDEEKATVEKYKWIADVMSRRRPWQIREKCDAFSIGIFGLMKGVTKINKSFSVPQITNFLKNAVERELIENIYKTKLIRTSGGKKYRDSLEGKAVQKIERIIRDIPSYENHVDKFIDEFSLTEEFKLVTFIDELILNLRPDYQKIVNARMNEIAWKDISIMIGCSPSAAERRWKVALKHIRIMIEKSGDTNGIQILQNYLQESKARMSCQDQG